MKYVLIICDDASIQLGPEEVARHPDHQRWVEEMDHRWVLLGGCGSVATPPHTSVAALSSI